jgi:mevalonate kinase
MKSHAKWILSGEHSVVRGGKAIAFPLRNYTNSITFDKNTDFSIVTDHESLKKTIFSLLKRASKFLKIPLEKISGRIGVTSNIPLKAGLGSSAAICANIANLFRHCGLCDDAAQLARHLEDKFHQKSSGLDIAVAIENKPVIFEKNKIVEFLKPKFWPHFVLSYSGEKSLTSNCAEIVGKVFLKDENFARELDKQMDLASNLCEDAMKTANFDELKEGVSLSNEVFQRWGLSTPSTSLHIKKLLSGGAAAAKPIGSGLGGYILSLWRENPTEFFNDFSRPYILIAR